RGAGGEPPRLRLRGLTCPAFPAGVEHLPLQSTNEKFDFHKGNVEISYATAFSFVAVTDFI
ncbi:hypothetical protein KYJ26_20150, partial [Bacillus sp. MCCB 382]|uniref:hypothetical protein n=1 Tax=Bacillus sp. MCCB 382 TaxID=2860197 RepID=UPI001C561F53|nr:hypothetical protein [Bacillus sp. MCCB 382]